MTTAPTLASVIEQNQDLLSSGASLHWLVPFEKRPIAGNWSELPRQTETMLRDSYRSNANIGIRLGEPSKISDLYLHIIDLDIRNADLAGEAWAALLRLLPEAKSLPSVISGSGGESRHLYFLTDKPFRKKKLLKSSGYTMVFEEAKDREVKKFDWEIDMMGTGSQAVIPPSIHPVTKKPYFWERSLDLSLIGLGIGPIVPSAKVSAWGVDEVTHSDPDDEDDDDLMSIIIGAPMQLEDGQVERILGELPEDWVEDRDNWLTVGAALHHQFEGSNEGFDRWCEWSKQSAKFDAKDSARVWKSFKGSKTPVRMATLIQAASANRMVAEMDFEDDNDHFDAPVPVTTTPTSLDDLLDLTPQPRPAIAVNNVEIDPEWPQLLHRNEDGELKSTLHNIALIVRNDRRTAGIMAYNEFTQEIVLRGTPGRVKKKRDKSKPVMNLEGDLWTLRDALNGDNWTDAHDIGIRRVIEAPTTQGGYGIKVSDRDLLGAINICANQNRFHPVRERLESLADKWDGRKRIETFFIDYLGCEDSAYHRQCSVLTLMGAVARAYEPGHKFDFVAILEGAQGAGKSTFINILGMHWSNELTGDIGNPQEMVGVMAGSWIMEIGELSSMHRSEVNDLKAFVSRTHDKARPPYGKRAIVYPRQCIFIGSTNDREYLRDATGNRRYWPIVCNLEGRMIDNRRLAEEVDQIWAEAVLMYREMRTKTPIGDLPLYLSNKDAAAEAKVIQESKRMETAEDALAAEILAWLDSPVVDGDGFDDPDGVRPVHEETCINQIWKEVLGRSGSIPHNETIKIGKAMQIIGWYRTPGPIISPKLGKKYGRCRVYFRDKKMHTLL
ncbi:DNA primase/polymerase domain protein [Rhodobacter phage RcIroh]|nr:DNA primase/polymerase domain protein [Rhodobacter phage RcIroh]